MNQPPALKSALARHETVLVLVILFEILLFSLLGRHFLGASNVSNLFRHSFEIGVLALAMTPVILTGGIDLSVGSMVGLCAVAFGLLVQDAGLPIGWAMIAAVGIGTLCGGLNAVLITRLNLPPLIVTLGTFSLFRGLAEAFTRGARSFSGFPDGFLALGNSSLLGLPVQCWILLAVAVAVWFLVHRSSLGRSFRAIGFSPDGARYAGIPVARTVGAAYLLTGAVAGLAAVILAARLGEARANAGMGYELLAITAVVLGGTSIFGGTGTVVGTLLGYLAVAILNNGLTRITDFELLGQPVSSVARELSGVLTGLLLLAALAATVGAKSLASRRKLPQISSSPTEKPSQP